MPIGMVLYYAIEAAEEPTYRKAISSPTGVRMLEARMPGAQTTVVQIVQKPEWLGVYSMTLIKKV